MNKPYIIIILLMLCIGSRAKTTYIPTYASFIEIEAGEDKSLEESNRIFSGLVSKDGTFAISIYHEIVDKEKVNAIKHAMNLAGWTAAATIMSGITTMVDAAALPKNYGLLTTNLAKTYSSETLSLLASINATQEKTLSIKCRIDNLSDKEISIADNERGLIWFLRPKTYLDIDMSNPGDLQLRIANTDANNPAVKYATVVAGSFVTKKNIEYENSDFWIYGYDQNVPTTMSTTDSDASNGIINAYIKMNRNTFEKEKLSLKEGKQLIKELKAKGE